LYNPGGVRSFFGNDRALLFTLSFLSLFIEVLLIRHLGSEIRIFAYFKNLTLIGAFLGLGVGYLYKPRLSPLVTLACVTFIAAVTHPAAGFHNISGYMNLGDFNMWEMVNQDMLRVGVGFFMLSIVFFAVLFCMVPLGQALAEVFERSTNRILDYSINIAGSLAGVWFFAGLSFSATPPVAWYVTAVALLFAVYRWNARSSVLIGAMAVAIVVTLTIRGDGPGKVSEVWSPYQKISVHKHTTSYQKPSGEIKSIASHYLQTNNTVYLYMLDLSEKLRKEHPGIFLPHLDKYHYYDLPYNFPRRLDDVLVLGSGGGNDVAGALRAGAKHVTAVEIDPAIIAMGKAYHPEAPYGSDKVTLINNDARNFLRTTDKKYDLIILGLLDSHTLTSSFSNTNLDSFMYTLESVGDMKNHLKPDGVLALSFQVNFPWIGSKIRQMMNTQFGAPPVILASYSNSFLRGTGGTYFLASGDTGLIQSRISADPALAWIAKASEESAETFKAISAKPQTDDWPYLYVRDEAIPTLHIMVSFLLLAIFALVYGYHFGKPTRSDIHFAALGAGFLLLEVSVISRFALFWGTTWLVSSIVISMILTAILLANAAYVKSKGSIGYVPLYLAVATALLMVYFTPLTSNLMVVLYLVPFSIIGYVFAKSFDSTKDGASRALAYNLFGALFGGLSESLSFVYGLSGLILVALGFYAISFVMAKR
jgi:hypothetical protein